jgi:predicted TIM-barrel fold metal-dependent hydrolase
MLYFDCNCEVGPRNGKDVAAPWSARDVLKWMDQCGIAGALVTHTLSYADDPVSAREYLARELRIAPKRLFPAWVALPPDAGDAEATPAELLGKMSRAGVRAVKLYPKTHNWPMAMDVIGPMLEAFEKAGVLTILPLSELPEGGAGGSNLGAYEKLREICARFPRLPVLLQGVWWSSQRTITALMARHANLHIEFSCYQVNRGLEEYARRFGAERLLFGTGLPAMSAGAARAYVDYARISPKDKAKVAGGNLARLLGGVTPSPAPRLKLDPLRARAAAGKPITSVPLYDAHCHVLTEKAQSAGGVVMYQGDAAGLVEIKDLLGVRRTAIISWIGPVASEPDLGNDIVQRALKRFPKRFWGLVTINPTHTSPARMASELRRLVDKEGFVGLKPYIKLGIKYSHPLYAPCWQFAEKRGLYALLHIGGPAGGMDVVRDLAKTYPSVQWVIAHTGGSFGMAREVVAGMKQHANIWAELTLTPVTNGVIEWMVSEVGDDRILFGTDAPMRDPRPQFGWVAWADLPLESRKKILGANYLRLIEMRRK